MDARSSKDFNEGRTTDRQWAELLATNGQSRDRLRAESHGRRHALADSTRRGVLEQLGRSEASITELAERFHMTLTGMRKHVGVLEDAGLVVTRKVGRVRYCRVGARRLDEVAAWIDTYHRLWDARFRELDDVLEQLKQKELPDGRSEGQ